MRGTVAPLSQPPAQSMSDTDPEMTDAIPSLELPPPMIPCKIYGHSYLDNKIQVLASHNFCHGFIQQTQNK